MKKSNLAIILLTSLFSGSAVAFGLSFLIIRYFFYSVPPEDKRDIFLYSVSFGCCILGSMNGVIGSAMWLNKKYAWFLFVPLGIVVALCISSNATIKEAAFIAKEISIPLVVSIGVGYLLAQILARPSSTDIA